MLRVYEDGRRKPRRRFVALSVFGKLCHCYTVEVLNESSSCRQGMKGDDSPGQMNQRHSFQVTKILTLTKTKFSMKYQYVRQLFRNEMESWIEEVLLRTTNTTSPNPNRQCTSVMSQDFLS